MVVESSNLFGSTSDAKCAIASALASSCVSSCGSFSGSSAWLVEESHSALTTTPSNSGSILIPGGVLGILSTFITSVWLVEAVPISLGAEGTRIDEAVDEAVPISLWIEDSGMDEAGLLSSWVETRFSGIGERERACFLRLVRDLGVLKGVWLFLRLRRDLLRARARSGLDFIVTKIWWLEHQLQTDSQSTVIP